MWILEGLVNGMVQQPGVTDNALTAAIKVGAIAAGYVIAVLALVIYLFTRDGASTADILGTLTTLITINGGYLAILRLADVGKAIALGRASAKTQQVALNETKNAAIVGVTTAAPTNGAA